MEFHLYRIKVEKPAFLPLFPDNSVVPSPRSLILSAIDEKPARDIRRGESWRLGNIEKLSGHEIFFALGKITDAKLDLYDEASGDFMQKSLEEAPHTYVAIDLKYQICAIAKKTRMASNVDGIAKSLSELLSSTKIADLTGIKFVLPKIYDPQEFLSIVRNAERISRFTMSFSPPNPWDVEKDFHGPMEHLLRESSAEVGKTTIQGESLRRTVVEELARSAASTGNKASAKLVPSEGGRLVTKYIGRNPALVDVNEIQSSKSRRELFEGMIQIYRRIREPG
ncbi:MAG: hypothetical protein ING09_10510 [Roseomonas sp.]|nr:hypothetical protein [Roseomonas sp.]MCA3289289.1 hypothetical protein [Roseomonas sp.]MCA3294352.1 hypothetical protein [Roseomonas sp.]